MNVPNVRTDDVSFSAPAQAGDGGELYRAVGDLDQAGNGGLGPFGKR